MDSTLPVLIGEDLTLTRGYMQDVVKVLGSLQLAYVQKQEHDWHYGLEVTMRGISTQELSINGQQVRATLDLVRHKVRIGETNWSLEEYAAPELFNNIKVWLAARGQTPVLEQPEFAKGARNFDVVQADSYAAALWWIDKRFRALKASVDGGLTSPILLYPHHFDLALTWFPHGDDQQLSIGFSTGDEIVREPYLYLTAYPEPARFMAVDIPDQARWQTDGFVGVVLPYAALQSAPDPRAVFTAYGTDIFEQAAKLF